jgi:hypothetical protein
MSAARTKSRLGAVCRESAGGSVSTRISLPVISTLYSNNLTEAISNAMLRLVTASLAGVRCGSSVEVPCTRMYPLASALRPGIDARYGPPQISCDSLGYSDHCLLEHRHCLVNHAVSWGEHRVNVFSRLCTRSKLQTSQKGVALRPAAALPEDVSLQ